MVEQEMFTPEMEIKGEMGRWGISSREIAKRSGIPPNYVSVLLNREAHLAKISQVLKEIINERKQNRAKTSDR